MTVSEALEMVHRVRAGSIRMGENGKLLARLSETECARLKPALDYLRDHKEEAARLLAKSAAMPAAPVRAENLAEIEPSSPIPEPASPGIPTDGAPEEQGAPCADPLEERCQNLPAPKAPKPRFNGPPLKAARRAKGQTVVFDGYEWLHAPLGVTSSTIRQIRDLAARGANIEVLQWPTGEIIFSNGHWNDREPPND
jgi:hypothetical protein